KADSETGSKMLQSVSQVGHRFHWQAPALGIKYHIPFHRLVSSMVPPVSYGQKDTIFRHRMET
ncbi:hypothetical protein M1N92_05925, partial [Dehalococcoidia bacterium]|nr:hypothetical protein [Dehalococcoidia bacterium]